MIESHIGLLSKIVCMITDKVNEGSLFINRETLEKQTKLLNSWSTTSIIINTYIMQIIKIPQRASVLTSIRAVSPATQKRVRWNVTPLSEAVSCNLLPPPPPTTRTPRTTTTTKRGWW